MFTPTIIESNWCGLDHSAISTPDERIEAILGRTAEGLPTVDHDTLTRYYEYLSANLSLPLTAYYPQSMDVDDKTQFRCTVLELLDPNKYLGDEFDGIFCKIRQGRFEANFPLIELHVLDGSPAYQLIEDYWYWFWNWR